MACMAVCIWNTTLKGNTFKSTSLGSPLKHWGPQAPCVSPLCKPLAKYLFLRIKECISCFGRTLTSHSSENCSAVKAYKCNCILTEDGLIHALHRCFIQGIKAMCPPEICLGYRAKEMLREMLVMVPAIALLLVAGKTGAFLTKPVIYFNFF